MKRVLLPLDPFVDDILAAKLIHSEEEVYKEFQECYQRATCCGGILPGDLREAAKALARMLENKFKVHGRY